MTTHHAIDQIKHQNSFHVLKRPLINAGVFFQVRDKNESFLGWTRDIFARTNAVGPIFRRPLDHPALLFSQKNTLHYAIL